MDTVSPKKRSQIMRRVRSVDTSPELIVRKLLHSLGYRFRLHRRDLPGKPDLVFPSRRKVMFIHGCFWHQHCCHRGNRLPSSNQEYWTRKLRGNVTRDRSNRHRLHKLGWSVFVVWECQTKKDNLPKLANRLCKFLDCSN